MMETSPRISVIVPVLNRERDIARCIESLLKVDYPSYEVIVVDNGSTDSTQETVSKYPVRLLVQEGGGGYAARNRGVAVAEGDIVAFTDSDCVVDTKWLKNLVRNYAEQEIGGVCGEILSYKPDTVIEQFSDIIGVNRVDLVGKIDRRRSELQRNRHQFLSANFFTANCSYKKSVLSRLGGFDTDFPSAGDVEFGWRVLKANYKLIYDPEALVLHKHRSTLRGLIKLFFVYGKDQPLLLRKSSEGRSYIRIKTYLLKSWEFGCRLPVLALVTVDSFTLLIVSIPLSLLSQVFAYVSLVLGLSILVGTVRETIKATKKTKKLRWLLLFPFLHIIRNYSFIFGRICGGIKERVVAV